MTAPAHNIEEALAEQAETFDLLGDWEERYRHVIDLGRDLAPLAEGERTDANKVRGCASQVWLVSEAGEDGRLRFRGDSDAHIVRGLIALLIDLYDDRRSDEILAFDADAGLARLGLSGALSRQRSNGLAAMVQRIRAEAAAVRPSAGSRGAKAQGDGRPGPRASPPAPLPRL